MSYANQDFWPAMGGTEKDLTTYVVQFEGNGSSDPAESTFVGGHIRDITRVSAGVVDIDFTSKEMMFKVIYAEGHVNESTLDGATDTTATQFYITCFVDETVATGTRVRLLVRRRSDGALTDIPATRRTQVKLLVMRDRPIYRYS